MRVRCAVDIRGFRAGDRRGCYTNSERLRRADSQRISPSKYANPCFHVDPAALSTCKFVGCGCSMCMNREPLPVTSERASERAPGTTTLDVSPAICIRARVQNYQTLLHTSAGAFRGEITISPSSPPSHSAFSLFAIFMLYTQIITIYGDLQNNKNSTFTSVLDRETVPQKRK